MRLVGVPLTVMARRQVCVYVPSVEDQHVARLEPVGEVLEFLVAGGIRVGRKDLERGGGRGRGGEDGAPARGRERATACCS
jgi:hypothetical protein